MKSVVLSWAGLLMAAGACGAAMARTSVPADQVAAPSMTPRSAARAGTPRAASSAATTRACAGETHAPASGTSASGTSASGTSALPQSGHAGMARAGAVNVASAAASSGAASVACLSSDKTPPRPRRAVPAIIEGMPAAPPPFTGDHYRPPASIPSPAASPLSSGGLSPAVGPSPTAGPPLPVPAIGCDRISCSDAAGAQYRRGPGDTLIDNRGRVCTESGGFIRCN